MKETNNYKFFFFRIITYSLLLIAVLSFGFIIYSGIILNQFLDTNQYLISPFEFNSTYLSLVFLFIAIIDFILILKRKIWAFYIFYFLIGFLLIVLFFQESIDYLIILLMLFIVLIFAKTNFNMIKLKKLDEDQEENLEENPGLED